MSPPHNKRESGGGAPSAVQGLSWSGGKKAPPEAESFLVFFGVQ